MQGVQIQEYLFQRIREKLKSDDSLAEKIAEHLFISNDSAYRRIRGETLLVLDEAKVLCEAYSISLDEVLNIKAGTVAMTAVQINNNGYGFQHYLSDIHKNLRHISSAGQKEIIYLTKDIPVFYNFLYRPLFAFRYFFWMKSILQHPDFISARFDTAMLPDDIEAIGKEINLLYGTIASTEIWNTECINSTISQIEYYREAGYFKSESDVKNIYDSLTALIEHIRIQAEYGVKFHPGENLQTKKNNFQFYYNRVTLGDNTILALIDGRKTLYLSYDVLNYMITQDEGLCNSVYEKFKMFMRRSTLISNASEKQRNIFFNILLKKIPDPSTNTMLS
jgi:hypothetical protein